jgi:CubicO group peptidase (beta-lactamase class C family)
MKATGNISMLLLVCFLFISCIQAEKVNQTISDQEATDELVKYLEKRIEKVLKKYHLPSLAIVLVDGEKIIFKSAKGMADIDKAVELNEDTYFKVWSIAKVFTALEIFREYEAGLVDINRPITDYLPDFKINSIFEEGRVITIKNILAHRSGLPRNECVSIRNSGNPQRSLDKFERSIHDCYLAFPPETRYKYSNLGYDLLGRVVEEVRDEGFNSYMDDNLLPLAGLTESTFTAERISSSENIATGYEYYKGKYYPLNQSENINSVPSGNLYTTLNDLQNFLLNILSGKGLFQKEETLNMMFQDHYSSPADPETMGLGWKTTRLMDNKLMAWHDGGPDDGTGALIAFVPEENIGLAIVSNSTAFGANVSVPLTIQIFNEMKGHDKVAVNPKSENKTGAKYRRENLKELAGNYTAFGQIMSVEAKKNKLKGNIGGIGLDLVPLDTAGFKVTHWTHEIGLTKIIPPPVDLDKLTINFIDDNISLGSGNMIINMDNISYEICPKYPATDHWPVYWHDLSGAYKIYQRLPGNKPGELWNGGYTISADKGIVMMSNPFGPIVPVSDRFIRIWSGPFAGEIMEYISETRTIIHQNAVFIPSDNE